MSIEDVLSSLTLVQTNIHSRFDQIDNQIKNIQDKYGHLEQLIETCISQQKTQDVVQKVAIVTSISSSEETVKQLNDMVDVGKQEDLVQALRDDCVIENTNIYSILKQDLSIYEMIVEIIIEFQNERLSKYLYAFSSTKNILYYWCHSKKTWTKLTKKYLKDIFDMLQMKMIHKYHEMISKDSKIKKESVENGDYIYADNFEKKYNDFKKYLYSRLV